MLLLLPGCRTMPEKQNISTLFSSLLNFINAGSFHPAAAADICCTARTSLYTPRIYLTADGCFDITITTIIPYDFFGLAPLETLDYITICCPELLDRLALPIYCVLLGKETADGAISHIENGSS